MANDAPTPTYRKVVPTRKLKDITQDAKAITRKPLTKGSGTRPNARIKVRR